MGMLQPLLSISLPEKVSVNDLLQDPPAQDFRNPFQHQLLGD